MTLNRSLESIGSAEVVEIDSPRSPAGRRTLSGVERVVAVTGFPLMISVTIGGTIVAIGRGSDPNAMIVIVIALAYFVLAVSERIVPWHKSWVRSHGDVRTDIGLALTNAAISSVLGAAVLVAVALAAAALSEAVGSTLWPTDWPLLAQLALALVVAEFVEYWFHRMMHEVPWMWRFHATHHSAQRLYWLNAARFHPIDLFLIGSLKMAPVAVLGGGLPVLALLNIFSAVHGAYQHSNLPVRIGPLNWIFSMTELHRWHHSKHMHESNHNYGGNLIVWDVLFGTRWLPEDRDPPEEIGMESLPQFPMGFWANLAAPFRWKSVVAESSGAAPSA
jgi:sterol desaturase/sphingolipid hydroxylase (fatty acid hydroxylase superfamily)